MYLVVRQRRLPNGNLLEERASPNYKTKLGAERAKSNRYAFGGILLVVATSNGW